MAPLPTSTLADTIEQRGPFTVKSREIMHDRFGMQLIADKIVKQREDGSTVEGEQFWINFPHEAVLIFAVQDNVLYLTREFTYGTGAYSIEVPGGAIEAGETPEQAAQRELQEELGLNADALIYLGFTRALTSRANNKTHLFLAKGVQVEGNAQLDPSEVIQAVPVPLEQAYAMATNGEITTASVEVGIWRLKYALNQEKVN